MNAFIELKPDSPVVPEDGYSVPAVKVDLVASANDARTGATVKSRKNENF